MKYANGLLFSPDMKHVALLEKNRPAFLSGKLCPVGGHVEAGESPAEAMARKYLEEAGVQIEPDQWVPLALTKTRDQGAMLATFFAVSDRVQESTTCTQERVIVMATSEAVLQCLEIPNSVADDLLVFIALAVKASTTPQPVASFDNFSEIAQISEDLFSTKKKKTLAKP